MKPLFSVLVCFPLVGALTACNGTTGDQLITFPAYAAGAKGAGDPFTVSYVIDKQPVSYTLQLTYAQMYVGAIYVNEAPAQNGGTFDTPACIDEGIYDAQVTNGLQIDLLDPTPQVFPAQGTGTADLGESAQLYLVDGDVNTSEINGFGVPHTADLVGTATREADGKVFSWGATVTINVSNRSKPAQNAGQPGANPICQQRIVNIAGLDLQLAPGGTLLLTIDPRTWFSLPIDFSSLPFANAGCTTAQMPMYEGAEYCIPDSSHLSGGMLGSQDGINLLTGIQTAGGAGYALTYSSQ